MVFMKESKTEGVKTSPTKNFQLIENLKQTIKKLELKLKKTKQINQNNIQKLKLIEEKRSKEILDHCKKLTGDTSLLHGSYLENNKDILQYFKDIIERMPNNVYWKDLAGRNLGANLNVARALGFRSPEEMKGKTDYDFYPADKAEQLRAYDKEVTDTGQPKTFEELGEKVNGIQTVYLTRKVPLRNANGKIIGLLGISIDITDRKKMENDLKFAKARAEEFNQLKTQFIENMQHDLRSPASGVMQALSYLSGIEKDSSKSEILNAALGSSEAIMSLLNEMVEADQKHYTNPILDEPFKLKTIFENVYCLHASSTVMKPLKFHYHIDDHIPKIVISDQYRLDRILLNLVGNAIKFTEKGEVYFEATLAKQEGRHLLIEFTVADSGIGISDDKKNVIFERFVRLDPSNRGIYKGIGLGLANAREYVRDLEGEFKPVVSDERTGTTFSILIPMKASLDQDMKLPSAQQLTPAIKEEPIAQPLSKTQSSKVSITAEKPTQSDAQSTVRGHLLLVEDSLPAQFMTKLLIKAVGCDLDIAGTAEDAFKMIRQNNYDLIFADIALPGMDGIEMTRHIRYNERKKGGKRIPIVGQSANASTANRKACIEAGMQDLLAKPLTIKAIKEMLTNYAETYALSQPTQPFTLAQIKNTKIIDQDVLIQIWKNIEDFKDGFNETKHYTLKDIDDFKQAYHHKDWKQLLFLTHKIRGGFVYVAANRVEEACNYLEEYLKTTKEPDLKTIEHLYTLILRELEKALDILEKL